MTDLIGLKLKPDVCAGRRGHAISLSDALATTFGTTLRGDGSPRWYEGKTSRPAQTACEARRARRNLVKLLRRSEGHDLQNLAERLQACALINPCRSGACPVCCRALQRLLVHASRPLFGIAGRYVQVTCICDEDSVDFRQPLTIEDIVAAECRIMQAARRAPIRLFGAIDVSANGPENGFHPPHYQWHAHVLAQKRSFDFHRAEFDKCYRPSRTIVRPLLAKPFDGNQRGVAYLFDDPVHKHARHRPLLSYQRVVIARLLDRAGIKARILMYGYELRTDGEDVWLATVSRPRADELLIRRRREAAQRQWQLANGDRQHLLDQRAINESWRKWTGRTLWR